MRAGRGRVDRDRQAAGIDQNHDFHAFSDTRAANPVAPALGLREGAVDKALVEPVAVPLLNAAAGVAQNGLEEAVGEVSSLPRWWPN